MAARSRLGVHAAFFVQYFWLKAGSGKVALSYPARQPVSTPLGSFSKINRVIMDREPIDTTLTIGQAGSENGIIVRDQGFRDRARAEIKKH